MLKFNTFRAARYLRSKFVEGKFLLASEGSDLELEMLDRMRDTIKRDIGDVVVSDAFKITRLSANQALVSPGEAWFGGLPYQLRSAKDQLVSGSNLAPGLLPLGVNVTDDATGRGKLINFNSGNTTPTGVYRVVITASEQVITTVQDPFLQNVNITEDTAQKVRLLYKINLVPEANQTQTPVPYTNETTGQNLTNQIVVTPTLGGNGELLLVTSVSGSTEIDGRKLELTVRNNPGLGGGNPIPNGSNDQASFANGTLIDSYGTAYHINAIFNDVVSTQVIIRIDSEIGSPQPQLINTVPYTLVKRDVFVQDDTNGTPLGNLFFHIAKIDFNSTDGIRHQSRISDIRPRKINDQEFQLITNEKFDIKLTEGGVKSFNSTSQLASWSAQFVLVNPSGPAQTIAANSAAILDGGSLAYEMNLDSGGAIDRGTLAVTVTGAGSLVTLSPVSLANVRLGNILKVGSEVVQITSIDDVNHQLGVSPSLVGTGSGTTYLDSFAPGTAPVDENTFILTVRHGSNVWSGGFPSFSSDEQEDRSAYLRSDNQVTWSGTQLSFTSDLVLEIINTVSGTITRHTILAANSPLTINNGDSIYVSINRASTSETVTPINSSGTPIPPQSQSAKDIFVLFRRVDAAGSAELHIPFHKQVIDPGQTVRLGASGSGSGSSSGTGDDINTLKYKASFSDLFPSPPTVSGPVNISAGFTDPNAYSPTNKYYQLNYDATKTVTGTSTAMTISSAPSFTIKAGDIIVIAGEARRITVVTTQTSVTIEAAFSTNPSAAASLISQAVYTVDLNNFAGGGLPISGALSDSINQLLIDYDDTLTPGDTILDLGVPPNIAFSASSDNIAYSHATLRTTLVTDQDNSLSLPSTGTNLYLRFFANKTSGSGSVNLLRYKVFFHSENPSTVIGFTQQQAYGFTDGSGAFVNASVSVVGGKTRITLLNGFTYTPGVNSGTANGQLFIVINGQKIPRFISSSATPDASYTEVDSVTVDLDSNYSIYTLSFEVLRIIAAQDFNAQNGVNIANIEAAKFRNYIINSNFRFNQRAGLLGSYSSPSSGVYNIDRWNYQFDGTPGTFSISQQAFTLGQSAVPDEPAYYWQLLQTVANSGSSFELLSQRIEGVRSLATKTATLSFWAQADSARTLSVDFKQFFGTGGSPSSAVVTSGASFSLSSSWQLCVVTVSLPSISGKTLGTDSNDYLEVRFNTPLNTTKTINIAHVMFNEGPGVMPWLSAGRNVTEELALCQRYFEKTYDIDTALGTAPKYEGAEIAQSSAGAFGLLGGRFCVTGGTLLFKVPKRGTTSALVVNVWNPTTGALGTIRNGSASTDISVTPFFPSQRGWVIAFNSGVAANAELYIHWTVEAEL